MSEVQKLFDDLNRRFFSGRLPRYRIAFSTFGGVSLRQRGKCLSDRRLILVHRDLTGEQLRRVLLHEMCHIGAPGHGRRWQSKLRRLADQGETWAEEEAKRYAAAPTWNRLMAYLRGNLDDWTSQSARPQFTSVVHYVAGDLGLTARETTRKIPWLKAAWRKACRWQDELEAAEETMRR